MSRYKLCPSRHFRRRLQAELDNGCPLPQLRLLLDSLSQGILPDGTLDRALSGRGEGYRECVVGSGFSLVYRYSGDCLILYYIKPPKKPSRFSMFLLTEIKYRLLRARGRTALLLCVAALLVGSLAFYLGNIQSNRGRCPRCAHYHHLLRRLQRGSTGRAGGSIFRRGYDRQVRQLPGSAEYGR